MEFCLVVTLNKDNTFEVYQKSIKCIDCQNSIITIDYQFTPWVRKEDNLLW